MDLIYFFSVALLVLGGTACYLLRFWKRDIAGPLAVLCSLTALVLASMVACGSRVGSDFLSWGYFPLARGLSADFLFRVTALTGWLNVLCLLFGFCVVLYSLTYWRRGTGDPRFYAFALWAVAGASVALMARNLLLFLFAWECVTLTLYLLIGVGGAKAKEGAAKTFSILGLGDIALVLGITFLVARGGWGMLSINHLQDASAEGGRILVASWADIGLFLLFLIAAFAKAGAFPLHTWIPAAAEGAPVPTMALLPAALDKLLGIVLLARVSLGFFEIGPGLRMLLMVLGVVTILTAVMMAMVQHELKRLLSFHAVSQVGYMVLGIGTGVPLGVVGGLFHMINNAIYKSLLFLGGGAVESETGNLELDDLGGLARSMPLTALAFLIGALSISGVPPLNGFVSKWMVYQGVIEGGGDLMPLLLAGAVLGSALTLASFVKALHSVFLGERSSALSGKTIREVGWNMLFPLGLLSGLCVLFGVFGGRVAGALSTAVEEEFGLVSGIAPHAAAISTEVGLWGPGLATVLILLALVLGVVFYMFGRGMRVRRVRTFLAGEVGPPGPTHVSGTSFYLTVRNLPILRGLYNDAEKEAFDIYRVGGMLGATVVNGLRKLHTGVLEVYVTWVVVGVAAVIALLFLLV